MGAAGDKGSSSIIATIVDYSRLLLLVELGKGTHYA
jgi:hypothetical protein